MQTHLLPADSADLLVPDVNLVPGVRDLLRPVGQPAASAGDDGHSGSRDLPGLVPSLRRAAPQTTRSGESHEDSISHFTAVSPQLTLEKNSFARHVALEGGGRSHGVYLLSFVVLVL